MERRKAITTAAAASLTLLAGAAGIALNSGIVGAHDTTAGTTPDPLAVEGVTIDADDPAARLAPTPAVQPTEHQPIATSSASAYDDDHDHDDDDDHEDDHDDDDD